MVRCELGHFLSKRHQSKKLGKERFILSTGQTLLAHRARYQALPGHASLEALPPTVSRVP